MRNVGRPRPPPPATFDALGTCETAVSSPLELHPSSPTYLISCAAHNRNHRLRHRPQRSQPLALTDHKLGPRALKSSRHRFPRGTPVSSRHRKDAHTPPIDRAERTHATSIDPGDRPDLRNMSCSARTLRRSLGRVVSQAKNLNIRPFSQFPGFPGAGFQTPQAAVPLPYITEVSVSDHSCASASASRPRPLGDAS